MNVNLFIQQTVTERSLKHVAESRNQRVLGDAIELVDTEIFNCLTTEFGEQ